MWITSNVPVCDLTGPRTGGMRRTSALNFKRYNDPVNLNMVFTFRLGNIKVTNDVSVPTIDFLDANCETAVRWYFHTPAEQAACRARVISTINSESE